MSRVPSLLLLTLALLSVPACDDAQDGDAADAQTDGPVIDEDGGDARWDGPPCKRDTHPLDYPFICVAGSPGSVCNDTGPRPSCFNGRWVCPDYTIPSNQCACSGPTPPGCTCTRTGWSCHRDAGADGHGD